MSARCGNLEIVKFLVTQGANIHADDDAALRYSAYNGRIETVKFLLIQGANVHAKDDEALKGSAQNGHDDVWHALSAFIQEKKLLVAALGSMPLVAASDSMLVLPALGSVALVAALGSISASTRVCSINSDAATSGTEITTCAGSLFNGTLAPPQKSSSVDVVQAQPLSTTKIKRSKI